MMSVNQLSVYHTLIETYNIVYKASSEKNMRKIVNNCQEGYNLRSNTNNDLFVLPKTRANCQGFSCFAAKLFNKLPIKIEIPVKLISKSLEYTFHLLPLQSFT